MHVYQTNPTHVLVEIEEMEQHEKCDSPALQINAGLAIDHVSAERSLLGGEEEEGSATWFCTGEPWSVHNSTS